MLISSGPWAGFLCAGVLLFCARTGLPAIAPVNALQKPAAGDAKSKKKPDASKAIQAGLVWLARHQAEDGSWGCKSSMKRCGPTPCFVLPDDEVEGHKLFEDHPVGLTGLAVLAFLRAGHLPGGTSELVDPLTKSSIKTSDVVTRGLDWLAKNQAQSGEFAKKQRSFVYDEALAGLAMSEALALTKDERWKDSAQRGATALAQAQRPNPSGKGLWGWHYVPAPSVPPESAGEADTSATGWCVVALAAAQSAGLSVKKESFQGALDYLDSVAVKSGLVGYASAEHAGEKVMGLHDEFDYHAGTMSSLGILIRLESGTAATNAFFDLAAKQVLKDLPAVSQDKLSVDYYYWYQGSSALNLLDEVQPKKGKAPKKYAEAWNKALIDAACAVQDPTADRCSLGGWVVSDRWSFTGGPVYATAITLMALESVPKPK